MPARRNRVNDGPITHLMLRLLVRKIVERCKTSTRNHHNRIERLPAGTTLPHLLRCQPHSLDVGAKRLPWHQSINCFERIALRRQCRHPLVRIKEPQLPHPGLRELSPSRAGFAQVSGRSHFSRCPNADHLVTANVQGFNKACPIHQRFYCPHGCSRLFKQPACILLMDATVKTDDP